MHHFNKYIEVSGPSYPPLLYHQNSFDHFSLMMLFVELNIHCHFFPKVLGKIQTERKVGPLKSVFTLAQLLYDCLNRNNRGAVVAYVSSLHDGRRLLALNG
jgi:hypothetical protein